MLLIVAIVRAFKVAEIVDAVESDSNFPGMTVLECRGFGREKSRPHQHRPDDPSDFVDGRAILVATPADQAEAIAARIEQLARTGQPGDGKVFILPLVDVIRIQTRERGAAALR